jgi:hypothetical protein
MLRNLFILINLVSFFSLNAASGDTTTIIVHQNQDLHWQGSSYGGKYDMTANFPNDTKSYQEIKMSFSIGCGNNGVCSHWDYDLDIYVGEVTNQLDSNVSALDTLNYQAAIYDTISISPLTIDTIQDYIFEADTVWNVFNVISWHELGRMITPYGTYMDDTNLSDGWDNTWLHTYTYDVTDFRPFLTNDAPIRVHYHGWQDGWRVTTKFDFIEGTPTREVVAVENVYKGGNYNNFAQFDSEVTPEKNILLPNNTSGAKLKVIVTGHGQYGEFTKHSYQVKANGMVVGEEEMWRYDCGNIAIAPQGGTWIFNRANWCPGDKVEVHEFELSDYITTSGNTKSLNLDIDFDNFVPSDAAYYSISAQLVSYTDLVRNYDLALEEIIAPNINENFVQYNSICANPIVRLKNLGKETITQADIKYWVTENNYRYFQWTGSLKMGESIDVTLDEMDWNGVNASNPVFYAEVSWPNLLIDQFSHNNKKAVSFDFPDVYATNNFKIRFKANNKPTENSYTLKDRFGTVLLDENTFNSNSVNDKDIILSDGCYVFEFYDVDNYWGLEGGGDGISWWLNSQNSLESIGYLRLINNSNGQTLKTFEPDFGSKIFYSFTVNNSLDELPVLPISDAPIRPQTDTIFIDGEMYIALDGVLYGENTIISAINDLANDINQLQLYPNPAKNSVSLYVNAKENGELNVQIINVLGAQIDAFTLPTNQVVPYALQKNE